jgi:predicted ATP-grasp superfamily ATP-dependent carboligase
MTAQPLPRLPDPDAPVLTAPLPGVVILGGAHNALALARSFGRKGLPVIVVSDDHPLPRFSRYVRHHFAWSGSKAPNAAPWLFALAGQENLQHWLLLPCADADVQFVAEQRDVLSRVFTVVSCDWATLLRLCDKKTLVETATRAGVVSPKSYPLTSVADAMSVDATFPVIVKPAMRGETNALTSAKAWRADTREQLVSQLRDALELQGNNGVVVQELIPGGGEAQFSYAALWHKNAPVAELTARRTRQYPIEFGYTSTFVEVVNNDEVMTLARRLLGSVGYEGLVEVEFKYDARTRTYKILDVNPRSWSWLSLWEAAGFDFAGLTDAVLHGRTITPHRAETNHAWVHLTRDTVACIQLWLRGQLTVRDWWKAYRQHLTFAAFAADDPLPALAELPVTIARVIRRSSRKAPRA